MLTMSEPVANATPLRLSLEVTAGHMSSPPAPPSSSAALLVLNAMSEAQRESLGQALHDLANSFGRKKNPLFVALDDSEEKHAVAGLIAQTAPAFTAARALLPGQWESPDGDVSIRAVPRCAPDHPCVILQRNASKALGRERFLAWPLGYAIILETDDDSSLSRIAEALRAPGSLHIGLVLTSRELHVLRQGPALASLQREAARMVAAIPGQRTPLVETVASLANVRSDTRAMSWLRLPPRTILIVPRLGALATPDLFLEEVRARLHKPDVKVAWLASPP